MIGLKLTILRWPPARARYHNDRNDYYNFSMIIMSMKKEQEGFSLTIDILMFLNNQ